MTGADADGPPEGGADAPPSGSGPTLGSRQEDAFWSNPFHRCALAAGFIAAREGRLADSRYVQRLCYAMYETALAERAGAGGALGAEPNAPNSPLNVRAAPTAHEVG